MRVIEEEEHTDCTGDEKGGMRVSEKRRRSIVVETRESDYAGMLLPGFHIFFIFGYTRRRRGGGDGGVHFDSLGKPFSGINFNPLPLLHLCYLLYFILFYFSGTNLVLFYSSHFSLSLNISDLI